MLSIDTMRQIKQSNVSKDAEKTKSRIKEEFAAASRDIKADIITQTTQNRNTIYRAINTGNASGRIVLAFSEVLDISPYYFTGVIDKKEPCTDEVVKKFLSEHGYKKLVPQKTGRKKRTRKADTIIQEPELPPVVAEEHQPTEHQPTVFRVSINESERMRTMVDDLDLASATQLLEALFIRAKAGGNAEQLCEIVKHCLLA